MVRTGLLLLVLAAAWLAEGVARAQPAVDGEIHPLPEGAVLSGVVTDVRLKEISGLAVSRRHSGIVWMHNDSHQRATD